MRTVFSTADFTSHHGEDVLSQDASTLGHRAGEALPGAITIGGVLYRYDVTRRDREGDIIAWQYVARGGHVATLYND